jgi:hypothetical protein
MLRYRLGAIALLALLSDPAAGQVVLRAPVEHLVGSGFSNSLEIGDVNGDGFPDALFCSSTDGVLVLLNDGAGQLGAAISVSTLSGSDMALSDLDGDGALDIVMANNSFTPFVAVLLGDGGGGFGPPSIVFTTSGVPPLMVAVGDVTGEGHPDILVGSGETSGDPARVDLIPGNGDGSFAAPINVVASIPNRVPLSAELHDLDGDRITDLVLVLAQSSGGTGTFAHVSLGLGGGAFATPDIYTLGTRAHAVTGDVSGDGIRDLVASSNMGVGVWLGLGDGSFGPAQVDATQGPTWRVAVGDLDGDGLADVATTSKAGGFQTSGELLIFRSTGGGGLAFELEVTQLGRYLQTMDIAMSDVDLDGRLDVLDLDNAPMAVDLFRNHTYGPGAPFADLGASLGAEGDGEPVLPIQVAQGSLVPGSDFSYTIENVTGPAGAAAWLVVGLSDIWLPFKGGTMVPSPDILIGPIPFAGATAIEFPTSVPLGYPAGATWWTQGWIQGMEGGTGVAATTAIQSTVP